MQMPGTGHWGLRKWGERPQYLAESFRFTKSPWYPHWCLGQCRNRGRWHRLETRQWNSHSINVINNRIGTGWLLFNRCMSRSKLTPVGPRHEVGGKSGCWTRSMSRGIEWSFRNRDVVTQITRALGGIGYCLPFFRHLGRSKSKYTMEFLRLSKVDPESSSDLLSQSRLSESPSGKEPNIKSGSTKWANPKTDFEQGSAKTQKRQWFIPCIL